MQPLARIAIVAAARAHTALPPPRRARQNPARRPIAAGALEGLGECWAERNSGRAQPPAAGHHSARVFGPLHQAHRPGAHLDARAQPQQQQQPVRELGSLIRQALDFGFVFALHKDGKIMYISETASTHLGLPQIDLSGSSVFEYTHQADHAELSEVLSLSEAERRHLDALAASEPEQVELPGALKQQQQQQRHFELGRSFCLRLKCILPKRNAGLVSNGYKVIHCSGYLKVRRRARAPDQRAPERRHFQAQALPHQEQQQQQQQQQRDSDWECYALVAVGHSLLPSALTEVKLASSSFMFRANLDLKLYYVESQAIKLLGYQQADLVGQSLYQLVHLHDVRQLDEAHRTLLRKGQAVSRYFRLMRKSGGHIWLQAHAALVNNPRSMPKPQHVVSICTIISDELAASHQTCAQLPADRCGPAGSAASSQAELGNSARVAQAPANSTWHKCDLSHGATARRAASRLQLAAKIGTNDQTLERAAGKRKAPSSAARRSKRAAPSKQPLEGQASQAGQLQAGHVLCASHEPQAGACLLNAPPNQEHLSGCLQLSSPLACQHLMQLDEQLDCAHPNQFAPAPTSQVDQLNLHLPNHQQHQHSYHQTIGSTRRASDDSCSVVSSVVSSHSGASSNQLYYFASLDSNCASERAHSHLVDSVLVAPDSARLLDGYSSSAALKVSSEQSALDELYSHSASSAPHNQANFTYKIYSHSSAYQQQQQLQWPLVAAGEGDALSRQEAAMGYAPDGQLCELAYDTNTATSATNQQQANQYYHAIDENPIGCYQSPPGNNHEQSSSSSSASSTSSSSSLFSSHQSNQNNSSNTRYIEHSLANTHFGSAAYYQHQVCAADMISL